MFEAKSIQSYIFRTGKLRDVIAASERLDQLIDTDDNSLLSKILKKLPQTNSKGEKLNFIRRKGGALYVYCSEYSRLASLRKVWTITVQYFFPALDFIDGIAHGSNLVEAIDNTHKKLSENRNNPCVKVPLFSSNMLLSARTARPACDHDGLLDEYIDLDTSINRTQYQLMKKDFDKQFLYKKFIDKKLIEEYFPQYTKSELAQNNPAQIFPLDLNPDDSLDRQNAFPYIDDQHDLALIHIDGNGIGALLKRLKNRLINVNFQDYKGIFRGFSDVLCASTEEAAKSATKKLVKKVASEQNSNLPMRPLVMGGDDITLFCRSDLALAYAQDFCLNFQKETTTRLNKLYNDFNHLNLTQLPQSLTASGGIVFQKATQPFNTAHHLVEELCAQAKKTSKTNTIDKQENGTGAPALAFMRIATAQDDNYQRLFDEAYKININDITITTSIGNYIISKDGDKKSYTKPKLTDLINLVDEILKKDSPFLLSLFRKILTQLHHGNINEAQHLIDRAESNNNNTLQKGAQDSLQKIKSLFETINFNKNDDDKWWLWSKGDSNEKQTVLADLITLAKFKGEGS